MPAVLQPNAAIIANLRRKTVGDEDIAAAKGHAAGILFVAPDGDVLLLRRAPKEANYAGHWALPGGGVEDGESPEEGARREAIEEMGPDVPQGRRKLIDQKVTPTGMVFHTFAQPVDEKFVPALNGEHQGYTWSPMNALPAPMHPAVQDTLTNRVGVAADMSPEDWQGMVGGLLKFLAEEVQEPEHQAEDEGEPPLCGCDADFVESDHPRAPDGKFGSGGGATGERHKPTWGKNKKANAEEARKLAESLGFKTEHYSNPKSAAAYYSHGTLAFNEAHKFWRDPVGWTKANKESGHLSSGHPEHVVHHEIGHALYDPPDNFMNNERDREIASKVSKYARMNPKEFVSEVHAGTQAGIEYPEDVMGMFKRYAKKRGASDEAISEDAAFALDRESVRVKDIDGRLHVADVPLCRESVDPYKAEEIPGWKKLGLTAGKIYHLWRPAEELEKALPSINGIPVLRKHVATSAADHKSKDTIGAVGTTARWEPPFIRGELVIWPEQDIELIENKEKYNLSPGYIYIPVMENGDFNGQHFDGKMTALNFNHLAVVEAGRQAEVAIDSAQEIQWARLERAIMGLPSMIRSGSHNCGWVHGCAPYERSAPWVRNLL